MVATSICHHYHSTASKIQKILGNVSERRLASHNLAIHIDGETSFRITLSRRSERYKSSFGMCRRELVQSKSSLHYPTTDSLLPIAEYLKLF